MKYKARLWLTLVLLFLPLAGWAQEKLARLPVSQQDVQRLLRTDFYGVYFLGKKVGWAKNACTALSVAPRPSTSTRRSSASNFWCWDARRKCGSFETFEFAAQPPYALRSAAPANRTARPPRRLP